MHLTRSKRQGSRAESSCSLADLTRQLQLLGDGWTVVAARQEDGRIEAPNDFVVVGPAGVFVIDVHHLPGEISVRNDILRHEDRAQDWRLDSVTQSAAALAEHLPEEYRGDVHSMLILMRRDPLLCLCRGAVVSSPRVGAAALAHSPTVWSPEQVDYATAVVGAALRGDLESIPRLRRPRRARAVPTQRGLDAEPKPHSSWR